MTLELSYASPVGETEPFSAFGYTAAGISASLLLIPLSGSLISTYGAWVMGNPAGGTSVILLLRLLIAAQMLLMIGIPAAGLATGILGIATSHRRCALAGMSTGFNAALLACLYMLPGGPVLF